jgi:TPR repeat protein
MGWFTPKMPTSADATESAENVGDAATLQAACNAFATENHEEGLMLLSPLVARNVAGAIGLLGLAYQLGLGVERSGLKAAALYKQAIALGDGTAAHNLGTLYSTGMPDVAPDRAVAKAYYLQAKQLGAQHANDEWYN